MLFYVPRKYVATAWTLTAYFKFFFSNLGSETTATTLCGIGNSLVQCPVELRKLEVEIRQTFDDEAEITLRSIQGLPFLNAVIAEGLRMCHPVAGGILRSVTDGGSVVCGHCLPKDVSQYIFQTLNDGHAN